MRSKELVITDVLPAYFLYDYAIMGSFALTTKQTRYILDEYAIDYEGQVNTPGHHFSKILSDVTFPRKTLYHDTLSYPYKAIPCKHPYCFYVDIRHAFSQIASVVGIDCSHREGRYMAFGTTPLPAIFEDSKIMRALLVSGTGKESSLTEWKNHEINTRRFPNRNHAPMLQRAIFGLLHAIGHGVSRWTIYHHTDGFVVPYGYIGKVRQYLEERGIEYSVKHEGITQVYGSGSYRVGKFSTRVKSFQSHPTGNIRGDSADWWLKQWERGKSLRS